MNNYEVPLYLHSPLSAAQALSDVYTDLGSGPILLDNVACTGFEDFLVNCTVGHNALEDYHSEDAGVRCFNTSGILNLPLLSLRP